MYASQEYKDRDIQRRKDELRGTEYMYLKNASNYDLEIRDRDGVKYMIRPGSYAKFKPAK